jgi:hypothetical protein
MTLQPGGCPYKADIVVEPSDQLHAERHVVRPFE